MKFEHRKRKLHEAKIAEIEKAEKRADFVAQRGDYVAKRLQERLIRNHWSEAVLEIARRERPRNA